jgi:hypothetical protein
MVLQEPPSPILESGAADFGELRSVAIEAGDRPATAGLDTAAEAPVVRAALRAQNHHLLSS